MTSHTATDSLPSCDTVVVLAPRTRAGATLLAKNSDRPPMECQPLFQAPRRRHPEGSTVNCQYLEIPQAAETWAVIGSRPFWLWGFEHGINEHGVAIGNEAVLTRESLPETGLLGMDLVRLGLERGRTAREATEVIGAFIERFGQGGSGARDFDFRYSGGFLIADANEAYVLESSGRQWAATQVRERACISNLLTAAAYDIAAPDVKSYARERGWWDGAEPFEFASAYTLDRKADPLSACARLARTRELVARGGKRTLREMFSLLRDHYELGEMPVIAAQAGTERSFSICMHNIQGTTASMVAELPAPGADALAVMWASFAAPCASIFFPLFVGGEVPRVLAAGAAAPSADSPWWRMKRIQDLVAQEPRRLAPIAWEHLRPLENAMLERAAEVAHKARKLDPAARGPLLTDFMTHNVVRVLKAADKLTSALERASA
jgi:secernin